MVFVCTNPAIFLVLAVVCFSSKEIAEQPTICVPQCFTRFDMPTDHLHLEAGEQFTLDADARKDYSKTNVNKKRGCRKQSARAVNFQLPNFEIPTEPDPGTKEMLKDWLKKDQHRVLKKVSLFPFHSAVGLGGDMDVENFMEKTCKKICRLFYNHN